MLSVSFSRWSKALMMAMALVACSEPTSPNAPDDSPAPNERVPTALELDRKDVMLEVGYSILVRVHVLDQYTQSFDKIPGPVLIKWASSDSTVAVVENGMVVAVSSGLATITASAAGLLPASVRVIVYPRGMRLSYLQLNYTGGRTGAFNVSSAFHPDSADRPPPAWGDATLGKAESDWSILAVQPRPDGLFDVLEIGRTSAPVFLFLILRVGVTADGKSYQAEYSADPLDSAVQVMNEGGQLTGKVSTPLYGQGGTIDLIGEFSVPIVATHLAFPRI